MVWITHTGLVVPRLDGPPEFFSGPGRPELDVTARTITVDLPALALLERLAGGMVSEASEALEQVGAELALDVDARSRLASLVDALAATELLVDTEPQSSVPSRRHVEALAPAGGGRAAPTLRVDAPAQGADPLDAPLVCPVPVAFPLRAAGFVVLDHGGSVRSTVRKTTILVAASFVPGWSADDAFDLFAQTVGTDVLTRREFDVAVRELVALGLLRPHQSQPAAELRAAIQRRFEAFRESDEAVLTALAEEVEHERRTGVQRTLVVPIDTDEIPQLSLGMVVAYAKAHQNRSLLDRVRFTPLLHTNLDRLRAVLVQMPNWPTVFLFSHYLWTAERCLQMAETVKELRPSSVTIHGGPSVPKYEEDARRWFDRNPQVDVAVRGEGEATLAEALDALTAGSVAVPSSGSDLAALRDVAGLTYRTPSGPHRTVDRERVADLDILPSPYLSGEFDHGKRFIAPSLILETNRGCPYGCTFCDWGSATLSRIRKFDIARVRAEMEWAAQHQLEFFMVADANFGMLDRDVEIVEYAVELKRRYGAPNHFWVNYAKNKVGNLARIVRILREGGIGTQCVASVQSFDAGVLKTIRRSNIKLARYDALTDEFRLGKLPLYTDIMIGLPGSTVATLRNDLQAAIDRELQVRALPTQLLVNSPMNDPDYRLEHGIVAEPDELLRESRTYTRDDWLEMMATRRFFYFAEKNGTLRQIATFVRAETGMREIDFYQSVCETAADRTRWPYLAYLVFVAPDEFVPPGSWWPVIAEVGRYCVTELGMADDSALDTVLRTQHALLPLRGRTFPFELELAHDYPRWHADVLDAKLAYTDGTWPQHVAPLREYEPATLPIRDDDGCCEKLIGQGSADSFADVAWELDSSVARPKEPRERIAS